MSDSAREKDRPTHSIEPSNEVKNGKRGDHEIDAPKKRTDDEVGSDDKPTTRHE